MRAAKRGLLHKRILAVLGAQAVLLSATLSWADGNAQLTAADGDVYQHLYWHHQYRGGRPDGH